jgi:disulfide bond formation protein DsbB
MKMIRSYALYVAWVIALSGLLISFYFEEVLGKEPCPLCWYQRIGLFPLVILLGIASYRNDRNIAIYATPLALLGAAFALLQVMLQSFPDNFGGVVCKEGTECLTPVFKLFGFFTFPMFSALGFFAIAFFLLLARKKNS